MNSEATFDEVTGRWSDNDPKTDREKNDFCRRRTGRMAVILPSDLYDRAAAFGFDMRWYVRATVSWRSREGSGNDRTR